MMLCLVHQVVEPLLWCCVSMEFCIPLMAVKYLSLRSNLYTAVCQCYYAIHQPLQAEVSACMHTCAISGNHIAVPDKLRLKKIYSNFLLLGKKVLLAKISSFCM